jgi:hypothetical protein
MGAKDSVFDSIRNLVLHSKLRIQRNASLIASILINKFGTYPRILDFAISKNHFKISKFRKYSNFEVEAKAMEILKNVDTYRKKIILEQQENICPEIKLDRPRIAFLMSGPMNSITNNILANIANSYEVNSTLTLNQSLSSNSSQATMPSYFCFESLRTFIPKIIFFELHTDINQDSNDSILSKDFISKIKKEIGCEIYIICFDIWREFDVKYLKYWSSLADKFIHFDEYSAAKLHKEFPMFNWLYPALNKPEIGEHMKGTDLFFQGSIREYDRRKILVYAGKVCRKFGVTYQFNTFTHHTHKHIPTREEYLRALSQSQYCLSVSQKAIDHWLVTFRSVEAINAGVIPIQQTGDKHDPLANYYLPYQHYLPFDSPLALAANIYIIKNHKEVTDFITERLQIFHRASYGRIELWDQLLSNKQTKLS